MTRARPWSALTPTQRTERVRPLVAEGQAPSIIAFRLRAPKDEIAKLATMIRKEELASSIAAAAALTSKPASGGSVHRDVQPEPAVRSAEGSTATDTSEERRERTSRTGGECPEASPQDGGRGPAGTVALPSRPWADRDLCDQREAVQSMLEQGYGVEDIAVRFVTTADEVRALLKVVFRRALDADFPDDEPDFELPAFLPPAPAAPSKPPSGPEAWAAMSEAEREALVKAANAAGERVDTVAKRFKIGKRLVSVVSMRLRARGELVERRGGWRKTAPAKKPAATPRQKPGPKPKQPKTRMLLPPPAPKPAAAAPVPAAPKAMMATVAPRSKWERMSREERETEIIRLRRDGKPYREIAEAFGAGLSSIFKFVNVMKRAGIDVPGATGVVPVKRKPAAMRSNLSPARGAPAMTATTAKLPWKPRTRPAPQANGETSGPLGLMHLTETTCRWPVGKATGVDARFCGAACPFEESYCGEHSARAYVAPPKRLPSAPAGARDLRVAIPSSPWRM